MLDILFICHGNICRSPMAEFVMKDLTERQGLAGKFQIASAATSREELGNDIHPGTRRVLEREGIPFSSRQARQITKSDYEAYDYIIAMDRANLRNLERLLGGDPERKFFFSWNLPENTRISPTPGIREILTKPTGTSNRAVQLCWNFYCNNINYKNRKKG